MILKNSVKWLFVTARSIKNFFNTSLLSGLSTKTKNHLESDPSVEKNSSFPAIWSWKHNYLKQFITQPLLLIIPALLLPTVQQAQHLLICLIAFARKGFMAIKWLIGCWYFLTFVWKFSCSTQPWSQWSLKGTHRWWKTLFLLSIYIFIFKCLLYEKHFLR